MLFNTGHPISPSQGTHVMQWRAPLSPSEYFHSYSGPQALLSTHPGGLCPLLIISSSPHPASSNFQRGHALSSGHCDPTSSSQPEAALLHGMVTVPTNLGQTCPRAMVLLPVYTCPVLIRPCRTHDGPGSSPHPFQELNFPVTWAWPS